MSEVKIRPITVEDAAGYHAAFDEIARERKFLAQWQADPLPDTIRNIEEHIARGLPRFIAVDGGRVVGFCELHLRSPLPSLAHGGELTLGVVATHRGLGLGRRLIEAAIAAGWAYGFDRIGLLCRDDNVNAIALYEKVGFRIEGRIARDLKIDGQFYDGLTMVMLPPA